MTAAAAGPDPRAAAAFILRNTTVLRPPHVPEIALHLADEAHALWHRTEEELEADNLPPPFWAFAWAGGQGLARHVLDRPEIVRGRAVLDFASGSGLVAIAAAMAGAGHVTAVDIDPWSEVAISLNAALNGASVETVRGDIVGAACAWDVVLAGDVFYDRELARRVLPWFAALGAAGAQVLIGDPGRAYLPRAGLAALASYDVAVTRVLEDSEVKHTTVWQLA